MTSGGTGKKEDSAKDTIARYVGARRCRDNLTTESYSPLNISSSDLTLKLQV